MSKKDAKEPFARWQGVTTNQMGFLNNLIIGLGTGLLAFEIQIAFNINTPISFLNKILIVFSIIFLTISISAGICLAYNRLIDFRKTTQINNNRRKGREEDNENLKEDTNVLGANTWKLLDTQILTFATGGIFLVFAALIRLLFGS